jgi:predicted nucleic acid-binding protein
MVSQNVIWKRDSVYEKKKKKKKRKRKSRVSSNWANIDANITTVSNIRTTPKKKKAAKIIMLAKKKCKPFLGVLVSTSMSASLPATGAC